MGNVSESPEEKFLQAANKNKEEDPQQDIGDDGRVIASYLQQTMHCYPGLLPDRLVEGNYPWNLAADTLQHLNNIPRSQVMMSKGNGHNDALSINPFLKFSSKGGDSVGLAAIKIVGRVPQT